MNTFRTLAFLVVTLGEIAFGLWALTEPLGFTEYGYSLNFIFDFRYYLISMVVVSTLSIALYWKRLWVELVTAFNIYLAVLWLSIGISPMLVGVYTISLPLYFLMFTLRLLMSIMTQSEGSYVRNYA